MALIPKISVCQPNDCTKVKYTETTGAYDNPDNLGGYGAPNITSASVTSFILKIYPVGYTVPIIFTYTVAAGVITACTRTDPGGTPVNVYTLLTSTVFPFIAGDEQVFSSALLGLGTDINLESGNWFTTYTVSDGTNVYTTSSDDWFFCTSECCVKKMLLKITPGNCGCESDSWGSKYRAAKTALEAASYAASWGLKDQAQLSLDDANKICQSNCKDC